MQLTEAQKRKLRRMPRPTYDMPPLTEHAGNEAPQSTATIVTSAPFRQISLQPKVLRQLLTLADDLYPFLGDLRGLALTCRILHSSCTHFSQTATHQCRELQENGNNSFAEYLAEVAKLKRFKSPITHFAWYSKILSPANCICFDVDADPYIQGPPSILLANRINVGCFSRQHSKEAGTAVPRYVRSFSWMKGRTVGIFYPRGSMPHVTAMLGALQNLGVRPQTVILDVCLVRPVWFPPAEVLDGLANVIAFPELVARDLLEVTEILQMKAKFDAYRQAFCERSQHLYVLCETNQAKDLRALVPELLCVDRLPAKVGTLGNRASPIIELLRLLDPLQTAGFDTVASQVPSALLRDLNGAPRFLPPSPGAADSPTLLVTDASVGSIPALIVTDSPDAIPGLEQLFHS
eukprot:TRINITY_DN14782_c0_g1_i1.p1 TRINITY_DN14782_c0_g1~~TRINITY_DN14782_c0_g1_i1.p1  ORF type:complete len:413 (-),score=54.03 TRINITY_DN14782_c0_g1_i1:1244-2461(-)